VDADVVRAPSLAKLTLTIAIDWSGARAGGGRRDIAIAECEDGQLRSILSGLSREDVRIWLCERRSAKAADGEGNAMVVGLDFSFSLPEWFAAQILQAADFTDVWDAVATDGESWLTGGAPWPFWGRGDRLRSTQLSPEMAFRRTELEAGVLTHTRPKSVFQLVGSGQVGTGTLRGIPILRELRRAGFSVWPFDTYRAQSPMIVEIYPRLFTGAVVKSSLAARTSLLATLGQRDRSLLGAAAATEHAFDAACSALVMSANAPQLTELRAEGPPYDVEGRIWGPRVAAKRCHMDNLSLPCGRRPRLHVDARNSGSGSTRLRQAALG
jgi:hypothetical protein